MSNSIHAVALKIIQQSKPLLEATYVAANMADYQHLDLAFYKTLQSSLENQDFSFVADWSVLEVANSPNSLMAKTFIRSLVSANKSVVVGYYQVSPRRVNLLKRTLIGIFNLRFIAAPKILLKNWKVKHCYDIETELNDGTFVITTNAEIAGTFAKPPSIETEYFAYDTSMKQLLQRHNDRLAIKLKNNAEVSAIKIGSVENLIAMQAKQQAQKKQHRIAAGLISIDELEKMAGNGKLAKVIHEEIKAILKEAPL